jgi:putative transcriptional regulator
MTQRSAQRSALTLLWLAGAISATAQDLAAGRFLVAARAMPDPSFAQTVIVLLTYDASGAAGLIVNRRSDVPASRALRELKEAQDHSQPVFVGGPVALRSVIALLRSPSKPRDAIPVLGDVYRISSRSLLEETLRSKPDASRFRVYLGYSGWGPGQLDRELSAGGWRVLSESAGVIFDPHPDSLWSRLIVKTELRIAFAPRAPAAFR